MTIKLPGVRHALSVGSPDAMVPAGTAGNALISVPPTLRSVVRRYLLHHLRTAITLQVTVTASAADQALQTAKVTLAVWTYAGYR